MAFWQRVTVQDRTVTQTATGAEVPSYGDHLSNVEARVLPLTHTEELLVWAKPEEQAYEIQLRGARATVQPRMRVLVAGVAYDIREVLQPPPFGTPTTVLHAVRVTP